MEWVKKIHDWGEVERIVFSYQALKDGLHGIEHLRRAAENAMLIAIQECPEDYDNAVLGAYFHDIGRVDDSPGNSHAIAGAEIAEKMLRKFWPELNIEKIVFAIRYHADGLVSDDPLIGTIWDADRLELGRAGISMDNVLFSTQAGRRLGYERGQRGAQKL
jgi:uncharacterized protein